MSDPDLPHSARHQGEPDAGARLQAIDALPAVRRPLMRFVLAMLLYSFLADLLGTLDNMLFGSLQDSALSQVLLSTGQLLVAGLFGLLVIQQYRLLPFLGLHRGSERWEQMRFFWLFVGFSIFAQQGYLFLLQGLAEAPGLLALSLLGDLAIGFNEEIWFRGLLLTALVLAWRRSRRGHLAAILVSSLLFGGWHLTALPAGADPNYVVPQAIYASFLGILFAVIYLSSGSLWPAILAHGLFDFGATYFDAVAIANGEPTVFDGPGDGTTLARAFADQAPFILLSAVVSVLLLISYLRSSRSHLPQDGEPEPRA